MIKFSDLFKNSKNNKRAILILLGLFFLLFSVFVIVYFKREALLNKVVEKVISKAKSKYNLNVKISSYEFNGLSTVHFSDISIVPEERDSLAVISDFTIGVKLFPLIFGDVKISKLALANATVSLVKQDSISNYDFLFKKDSVKSEGKGELDLADLANKLINKALDKIPENMQVNNFNLTFREDTTNFSLLTQSAVIDNGELKSVIVINKDFAVWHVNGFVNPSDKKLDLRLFADGKKVEFPYLENKFGLKLNFDTVRTVMDEAKKSAGDFKIAGKWQVKNLLINHPKLGPGDILLPDASIDAKFTIGKQDLAIDSSSVVKLGNASVNPFVKVTLKPHKIYELKLKAAQQDAQELFNAFPAGLFESLEGIKVAGKLSYYLNFHLDSKNPNKVIFQSALNASKDFKILSFGKTNFQKINNVFIYTPYEKGKPVRDIIVGPGNSNFTSIDDISPNIKNALLTSEDPSFFSHKGFVEESIRQSIATNYKAKSFKRGGSTISMQLVKNVYLNRQKTIARKIEEILIVWLIENQKLTSKQRMFEVYLNIIEWGRNVYGIKEASNYYFGKHPSELSLGEAIYLANIVPKPKSSLYAWQPDGSLKPYLLSYFNLIGSLMARRGYTEPDSSAYGYYGVRLKESLRLQIAPADTVPDSLAEDNSEDLFQIFKLKQDSVKHKSTSLLKKVGNQTAQDTLEKSRKELRRERREKRREGL